jgi:hypothetical protein
MAHRLLRNNGFAPAWVEEAKDPEQEIDLSCRELAARGCLDRFSRPDSRNQPPHSSSQSEDAIGRFLHAVS